MQRLAVAAAVAVACVGLGAPVVRAQSAGDSSAGLEIAHRWCRNCHVVDSTQRQGSDMVPTFETIANRRSMNKDSLTAFLNMPHYASQMPDMLLSKTDRDNVIAYVLSLRHAAP